MTAETIPMNGTWKVISQDLSCTDEEGQKRVLQMRDGWLEATVPGEIHLDLMRAGLMPGPSVGNNAPECRWLETKTWWYQTTFNVDTSFLQHERQQLVFDGIDLYAQVFVNGALVGEAANAFAPVASEPRVLPRRPCGRPRTRTSLRQLV